MYTLIQFFFIKKLELISFIDAMCFIFKQKVHKIKLKIFLRIHYLIYESYAIFKI